MIKFEDEKGFAPKSFISAAWIGGNLFFSIYKDDPLRLEPLEACIYLSMNDFYEMLELVDYSVSP